MGQFDCGGRFGGEASPRFSSSRTAAARDGIRVRYLKSSMAAISSERIRAAISRQSRTVEIGDHPQRGELANEFDRRYLQNLEPVGTPKRHHQLHFIAHKLSSAESLSAASSGSWPHLAKGYLSPVVSQFDCGD